MNFAYHRPTKIKLNKNTTHKYTHTWWTRDEVENERVHARKVDERWKAWPQRPGCRLYPWALHWLTYTCAHELTSTLSLGRIYGGHHAYKQHPPIHWPLALVYIENEIHVFNKRTITREATEKYRKKKKAIWNDGSATDHRTKTERRRKKSNTTNSIIEHQSFEIFVKSRALHGFTRFYYGRGWAMRVVNTRNTRAHPYIGIGWFSYTSRKWRSKWMDLNMMMEPSVMGSSALPYLLLRAYE